MTKKQIRQIFNNKGIQINERSVSLIQKNLEERVERFACNALEWDLKRVKAANIEYMFRRKIDWLNKVKSK